MTEQTTREEFDALVADWWPESMHQSSSYRVSRLSAYRKMVALGPSVVPLVIDRLSSDPSPHWFPALRELTRLDAAEGEEMVAGAIQAWIDWALEQEDAENFDWFCAVWDAWDAEQEGPHQ